MIITLVWFDNLNHFVKVLPIIKNDPFINMWIQLERNISMMVFLQIYSEIIRKELQFWKLELRSTLKNTEQIPIPSFIFEIEGFKTFILA